MKEENIKKILNELDNEIKFRLKASSDSIYCQLKVLINDLINHVLDCQCKQSSDCQCKKESQQNHEGLES